MLNKEALYKKIALGGLFFITFLTILKPLYRLTSKVYIDYNEGWMAHFSKILSSGEPLYQPLSDFILNWYPPISFYFISFIGGDFIITGRIIALTSIIIVAICIWLIVKRVSHENYAPTVGALLFLSTQALFHTYYFGMNDPQWFAHAVMLIGFVVFIYKRENIYFLIFSIFLMLLAGYIKHHLISLPIAILLRYFFKDKKFFIQWFIISFSLLIISFILFYLLHGSDFFMDIFRAPRTYRIGTVARAAEWLSPHSISIAFSILFIFSTWKHRADNLMILLFIYCGISFVWGLYTAGAGGVYYNCFFDFYISLTVIVAIALSKYEIYLNIPNRNPKIIVTLLLFLPVLISLPFKLYETKEYVLNFNNEKQKVKVDIAFLNKFSDPVLVENLALSYWADKQLAYSPITTKEKIESGFFESSKVTDLINNKFYSIIQLDRSLEENYRFTGDMLEAIGKNYRLIKVKNSDLYWYIPKNK